MTTTQLPSDMRESTSPRTVFRHTAAPTRGTSWLVRLLGVVIVGGALVAFFLSR